jgi:hypothetical protein
MLRTRQTMTDLLRLQVSHVSAQIAKSAISTFIAVPEYKPSLGTGNPDTPTKAGEGKPGVDRF